MVAFVFLPIPETFHPTMELILFIFCTLYVITFMIYTFGWHKLSKKNKVNNVLPDQKNYAFSIIIPARNEAHQIAQTLNSILLNEYLKDKYQIIVVDDFSDDGTPNIAQNIFNAYEHQEHKVIKLEEVLKDNDELIAFKKKALATGIAQAKHPIIITTDADCVVDSKWLQTYNDAYHQPDTKFVIAPVNFIPKHRKSSLYYFQSIDFMTMQGITAASYELKIGNMCNGANLSFTKDAYASVNGYSGIDQLASGDDMMLYHKIAIKYPNSIRYALNSKAIVDTPVQDTWQNFLRQRIRWASKNGKYNDYKLTTVLAIVYLFNVILLGSTIYSLFNWQFLPQVVGIWVVKIFAEMLLVYPVSKFYKKQHELLYFVLLQPLHVSYIVLTGFLGMFKTYTWKGRSVN